MKIISSDKDFNTTLEALKATYAAGKAFRVILDDKASESLSTLSARLKLETAEFEDLGDYVEALKKAYPRAFH